MTYAHVGGQQAANAHASGVQVSRWRSKRFVNGTFTSVTSGDWEPFVYVPSVPTLLSPCLLTQLRCSVDTRVRAFVMVGVRFEYRVCVGVCAARSFGPVTAWTCRATASADTTLLARGCTSSSSSACVCRSSSAASCTVGTCTGSPSLVPRCVGRRRRMPRARWRFIAGVEMPRRA
jgi:hypothetical protein